MRLGVFDGVRRRAPGMERSEADAQRAISRVFYTITRSHRGVRNEVETGLCTARWFE